MTQEMARGFCLFREALLVFEGQGPNVEKYMKVATAIQSVGATVSSVERKKDLLLRTSLACFSERVNTVESSKDPEPMPSVLGMSEIATCPVSFS